MQVFLLSLAGCLKSTVDSRNALETQPDSTTQQRHSKTTEAKTSDLTDSLDHYTKMPSRSENDFGDDDEYRTEDNENDPHSGEEECEDEDAEAQTEEEPELRSTRQSLKRRATVSPPSAPPGAKKRGRGRPKGSKNKPKAVLQDPTALGKATPKEKKLSKAKLKSMTELRRAQLAALTYDTPITFARMEAHVGPDVASFDAGWTRADERVIGYHESAEKRDICAVDKGRHDPQLLLWKYCLSVCQRSPFDILSPRRGFCYLPSKEDTSMVVWSKEFCRDLTDILSNRIWNGDIGLLVLVLQYAVICRKDDRRLWEVPLTRFRGSPTDLLREELQASTEPLQTSIHELSLVRHGRNEMSGAQALEAIAACCSAPFQDL
ncbi:hypothetical protein FACUT_8435 [Fusarium acutatum]|uniref:Uncharacterized protein n=1 Tax=Fusarium acutatum TaxID=78861 RepID=A0A8H4JMR8_9HYPO|nr:hypothetical protein FACUT_8435 [Fusarium acutatum]